MGGFIEAEHVSRAGQLRQGRYKYTHKYTELELLAFKNRVTFYASSALFLQLQMNQHVGILAKIIPPIVEKNYYALLYSHTHTHTQRLFL